MPQEYFIKALNLKTEIEVLDTDRGDILEEAVSDVESAGGASEGYVDDAITTHEGASNPHPTYLTAAEGNAAYDAIGAGATALAAADAAQTDATTAIADAAAAQADATTGIADALAAQTDATTALARLAIPALPGAGTFTLKSVSDVLTWVEDA